MMRANVRRTNKSTRNAVAARVENALTLAAEEGVTTAREYAPVVTGRLQKSIHAEKTEDGRTLIADAPYAAYVEYGGNGQSATPFMAFGRKAMAGAFVKAFRHRNGKERV